MPEHLALYLSGDASEIHEVTRILENLDDIEVRAILEAKLLDGRVSLPFIETEAGDRHFGISAIERYVGQRSGAGKR